MEVDADEVVAQYVANTADEGVDLRYRLPGGGG